jgi:3-oxoacyl-[acyl-carrier-protein] synthase-3
MEIQDSRAIPLPAPMAPRLRTAPRGQRERGLPPVGILGTGGYAPERVLSNGDLERMVATSDEWIQTRTGMRERRIGGSGQATSDLAAAAGRQAMQRAGLLPEELELILVATVTPDHVCPPTACLVQQKLGAVNAAGFDVQAACSSFMNALQTGHALVGSGSYRNALVIGADMLSTITDYQDRESCILFGDGAGAVVLGQGGGGELLDHVMGIDGSGADLIKMPAGGSRLPASHATVEARQHFLRMEGRKVFKFAVARIAAVVEQILDRNGLGLADLDLLIPHQANLRILEAAAERLGLPMGRVVVNIERFGNTSSASVPLALDQAVQEGRLRRGQLACLVAFGGGLSWGASLLRW